MMIWKISLCCLTTKTMNFSVFRFSEFFHSQLRDDEESWRLELLLGRKFSSFFLQYLNKFPLQLKRIHLIWERNVTFSEVNVEVFHGKWFVSWGAHERTISSLHFGTFLLSPSKKWRGPGQWRPVDTFYVDGGGKSPQNTARNEREFSFLRLSKLFSSWNQAAPVFPLLSLESWRQEWQKRLCL